MSPNAGGGGRCGVSSNESSCVHHVTWSPNKLWRSFSIYADNESGPVSIHHHILFGCFSCYFLNQICIFVCSTKWQFPKWKSVVYRGWAPKKICTIWNNFSRKKRQTQTKPKLGWNVWFGKQTARQPNNNEDICLPFHLFFLWIRNTTEKNNFFAERIRENYMTCRICISHLWAWYRRLIDWRH